MSLNKKSKILIAAILMLAIGGFVAYKITYKPHKTVSDLDIAFSGNADAFFNTVKEGTAIVKDAAVQLTGKVTATDDKGITLNNNIYCELSTTSNMSVSKDQDVTIKARYIGYDDLLEEIKLDKTIILK